MQHSVNSKILLILMLTIYASVALAASNKVTYGYNPKPIRTVNGYRTSPDLTEQIDASLIQSKNIFDFKLQPNPASNNVQIVFEDLLPSKIDIFDLTGKLLLSMQIQNSKTEIDISSLNNGYYFIKASNELYGSKTKQLVIVK